MQTPTSIDIDGRTYEIIKFNTKLTNKGVSSNGIGLAKGFLAIAGVSPNYRIYNTQSGDPVLRGRFRDFKDALKFALWIERVYADYFILWEAFPEADILQWCQWTVPEGERLYKMKNLLSELDIITERDMTRAWNETRHN